MINQHVYLPAGSPNDFIEHNFPDLTIVKISNMYSTSTMFRFKIKYSNSFMVPSLDCMD